MSVDVYLEVGAKKVFACALEWPGWARSGRDEGAALDALAEYADRYAPVAARTGLRLPEPTLKVVERVKGSSTTDFGAIGNKDVAADQRKLTKASAGRLADLVAAAWAEWDDVVAGAPASLRKGPRGGGRDRDKMIDHVVDAEGAYATRIGVKPPTREAILDALRAARAPVPSSTVSGKSQPWPYRYAARRIAWHVLDHAWEMQDRS